ncbi:DUF2795 domain-containing protein [Marinactinospora thermotolerans]|uniref:DUF2795 domain-containing protein n=1 Tax=Marinactinospora thermotolerans DSM 45154 TaxID=1122192 RepID=A0A1T4RS35_9ACTN|nr:DUF2795 domain-containing protein [Marinactinospora thermotolerans]SKA18753.1 Protein of unknown function [Marinactinospora thermotolerans DSM 45154]
MTHLRDTKAVERALSDLDYPAGKDEVVRHAEQGDAPQEVLRALRALPLGEYANTAEVLRSLPLDPDRDTGSTPVNPIEEELGENRGS